MNKKIYMKILYLMGIILLKACEFPGDTQHYFTINNNTNHVISYYISETYPDTSIIETQPILKLVQPNSSRKESSWGTWNERFEQINEGKISIFIFHSDTLNKYSWDKIRSEYMVLKRFDLSLEDLKQNNFTINYP